MSETDETDESLRVRVINAYGMWGAFCTLVLESSGAALDALAEHVGVARARAEVRR